MMPKKLICQFSIHASHKFDLLEILLESLNKDLFIESGFQLNKYTPHILASIITTTLMKDNA